MKLPIIYYGIFSRKFNNKEFLAPNVKGRTHRQTWREYYKRNTYWPRGRWHHRCGHLDPDIMKKRQIQVNEWNEQIRNGERILTIGDCKSLYRQGADCVGGSGNVTIRLAKLTKKRRRLMENYS